MMISRKYHTTSCCETDQITSSLSPIQHNRTTTYTLYWYTYDKYCTFRINYNIPILFTIRFVKLSMKQRRSSNQYWLVRKNNAIDVLLGHFFWSNESNPMHCLFEFHGKFLIVYMYIIPQIHRLLYFVSYIT